MSNFRILVVFFFAVAHISLAQDKPKVQDDKPLDSLKSSLGKQGIVIQEATFEKKEINPLGPSQAAFYSAVLPGLGQIYNKRYWKAPIVWGALGIGIYTFTSNNNEYNRYRDAFKRRKAGFTDDEFYDLGEPTPNKTSPDVSDTALQDAQEQAQQNRDLSLLITIGLYALNIIDANVDAHLKQFNVDDRLGVDFKPYLDMNSVTNDPIYGLALTVKF